jgi:hypothetical protein
MLVGCGKGLVDGLEYVVTMLNADADTDEMLTTTLSPTTLLAPLYILVRLEHMTSHNGVGRRLTRVPMLSSTMRKKLYFVGSVC